MTDEVPQKLPITSLDVAADRRARLRALLPEVFREDKIDEAALLRSLGEWIEPGKERYGLNWPGKAECMRVIQTPSVGTLRPRRDQSVSFDTTDNLIIEGDNLEVLKLLQKSYYGKVKMIYIDPPYNTGKEFIYPDNYREGLQDYLKYSGQVDAEGLKVSANTETSGRYHSKWLSMMYPRLYLARNLLREDGVIFVSIDDHETHNLRMLMNEVFGEENFAAEFVWKKMDSPSRNDPDRAVSEYHEYVIAYARDASNPALNRERRDSIIDAYPLTLPDGRKARRRQLRKNGKNARREDRPTMWYRLVAPDGTEVWPIAPEGWEGRWVLAPPSWTERERQGLTEWIKRETKWIPYYLEIAPEVPLAPWSTLWDDVDQNRQAKAEFTGLLGSAASFETPKPSSLVRKMLLLATDEDDLVLDFFAGSGTMGHAVLNLNREDAGERAFILVQLPEKTEQPQYPTIADICRERVRRVIQKLDAEDAATDSLGLEKRPPRGFKALQLTSSNFHVWDGDAEKVKNMEEQLKLFAQHVEPGRSDEDLLYEILLKDGFALDSHIEKVALAGKDVFAVNDGQLLLCLDRELTLEVIEAMVNRDPTPSQIICLDAGFQGNDQLKVNAVQTVKSRNRLKEGDLVFQVV